MPRVTTDQFKQLLRTKSAAEIVDEHLINSDPGPYISSEALNFLENQLRLVFQLKTEQQLATIVVGSAKIGFAYLEKPARNGGIYKPAYREYQAGVSDIDIAIVSPNLYWKIWSELARHGASQQRYPWRPPDLGDYMLHGWIRPDKFPKGAPMICNDFKNTIYAVGRNDYFKYKRLRCGLYCSRYFLRLYHQRGVRLAQEEEIRA